MKIFWSWQSDRSRRVCKDFVRDALEAAVQRVAAGLELDESARPEIDHDTLNEPGMVDIVATILRKIEAAAVFVADMTPIAKAEQGKLVANPNVLIELGYAMKAIGPERILLVANTAWGGTPEDLPFDLRHRRGPLTYRLSRDASDEAITAAKTAFAEQLTSALSTSLALVIKNRDATAKIPGYQARPGDPSVWFAPSEKLRHRDFFGGPRMHEVVVLEGQGPRAYMRIIPTGWQGDPPERLQVSRVPDDCRLYPLGRWRDADGGMNELGVLSTESLQSQQGFTRTRTATQWFEKTGEIWGFDQSVCHIEDGKPLLAYVYLVQQWNEFLRRGLALMRHLKAAPPFRVEAGVTGLNGAYWGAQRSGDRVSALASSAMEEHQSRNWDEMEQLAFITRAYNGVRAAFGLPKVTENHLSEPPF